MKYFGKILLISMVLLGSACITDLVMAGECDEHINANLMGFAKEAITVSTSSVGFTRTTFAPDQGDNAVMALFTSETDTLRFWTNGSAPTSTVGHLVAVGSTVVICGPDNISNFRAIRSGSADATIQVSYYRPR